MIRPFALRAELPAERGKISADFGLVFRASASAGRASMVSRRRCFPSETAAKMPVFRGEGSPTNSDILYIHITQHPTLFRDTWALIHGREALKMPRVVPCGYFGRTVDCVD